MPVLTSWVHGTSAQVEYASRLASVRHIGPYARIEGLAGQNAWVHLTVPTPPVTDGNKLKIGAVLINFRTRTDQAWIHEVVVYDGSATVAEFRDLHLSGDHPEQRFDIPDQPEVNWALSITVGVRFSDNPPTVASTTMEFNAAAGEFIQ